ncbi:MAG: T9SS type A sorting domain-containing protein [Bacteroidota bacterium]
MKKTLLYMLLALGSTSLAAQYISEVVSYSPAPGQFINKAPWGLPESAASIIGGVNGSLCLGAFGGEVVFRFDGPVENHPDNPFGVDFTIFGNPLPDWSEPGVVWVLKDENGNGAPDDSWYELAGSDYYFSSTRKNYQVIYTNPGDTVARDVPWEDQMGNTGFIRANSAHVQTYYPCLDFFPGIPEGQYAVTGSMIRGAVDVDHPPLLKSARRAFGYADNQARGNPPYTMPDNPYTPELENAGGDAFDISWAVDPDGKLVELDMIHFVKVVNAVLHEGGWLGEVSTEITGAVDIPPEPGIEGDLELVVIRDLPPEIGTTSYQMEVFAFHRGRLEYNQGVQWSCNAEWAQIDAQNVLTVSGTGPLTLTASLDSDPAVKASVSTTVNSGVSSALDGAYRSARISMYPNPAKEEIRITGTGEAIISFYNASGMCMKQVQPGSGNNAIRIGELPGGVYMVRIDRGSSVEWMKLLKQ